jgi:hypothetical protein
MLIWSHGTSEPPAFNCRELKTRHGRERLQRASNAMHSPHALSRETERDRRRAAAGFTDAVSRLCALCTCWRALLCEEKHRMHVTTRDAAHLWDLGTRGFGSPHDALRCTCIATYLPPVKHSYCVYSEPKRYHNYRGWDQVGFFVCWKWCFLPDYHACAKTKAYEMN